jgi:hypothetical protein
LPTVPPGFKRDDLRSRYDVSVIKEDDWHSYSGRRTSDFLTKQLALLGPSASRLLNAGAGVYGNTTGQSDEVSVDLFSTPLKGRENAVCASVEKLPFSDGSFSCVLCVGEVLAYCDPAAALPDKCLGQHSTGQPPDPFDQSALTPFFVPIIPSYVLYGSPDR